MPDNLRSQIEGVFALFEAADIRVLARPGYEADDIIGSIAHKYENNGHQVVIISSDKDLCQFLRDGHVHIYDAMKRKFMKERDVTEKFGVPAHQVCDYLAIVGDSSDNIPGISGFGPKKAVDLLSKYETLE
jgi:DNA polymerase I